MRMELEDLPPAWREQAQKQLAERERKRHENIEQALPAGAKDFDSRAEWEYYMSHILPAERDGRIVRTDRHAKFDLLPPREYCGIKLPAARYTADFVLYWANGTVEVVEVKSRFVRKQQRDYIYRRRLFIDLVAEPKGWKFTEIITDE